MGAVILFPVKADIFPFAPQFSGIVYPLVCRESCHLYHAAMFQRLFQHLAAQYIGGGFCVLAKEQVVSIQLKTDQGIGVFFFCGIVLILRRHLHRWQNLRFRFQSLLLHLHFLRVRPMGQQGLSSLFLRIKGACRTGPHPQLFVKPVMVIELAVGIADDGNIFGISILHCRGGMVTGHNAISCNTRKIFLIVTIAYFVLHFGRFLHRGRRFLHASHGFTAAQQIKQRNLPAGNVLQIRFFFRLREDGKSTVHILMHLGQDCSAFLIAIEIQWQRRKRLIHCGQQLLRLVSVGKNFGQFNSRFLMEGCLFKRAHNFVRQAIVKAQDAVGHPFPFVFRHPRIVARF